MRFNRSYSLFAIALSLLLIGVNVSPGWSQSRRQPPTSNEKKNKRPSETPKQGDQQDPVPTDIVPTKPQDLEKPNFAIFADGAQQPITNFSTPEAPITVAMVLEYSKWSEIFGLYGNRGYEPGTYEVIRPTAMFLSQFIKPPDDYVSVVAFDIRPTPLTDFTNDPARLQQVISLLLRNSPAFRETNLFDA